jgi:hypothetical protein
MKFLNIFGNGSGNIQVTYFGNFATIGAYGVGFGVPVAFLVFGDCTELVVYHKVCVYKQRYCIVDRCTTYPEFLFLLKMAEQLFYLETAIYRVNGIEYSEPFRRAAELVLLEIFCKHKVYSFHNLVVVHCFSIATKLPLFFVL